MGKVVGWFAILLALFAVVIGIVPGAVSLIGLGTSMSAIVLSLLSIKTNGKIYFGVTTGIVLAGAFLLNDALRVWDPVPMPSDLRYGLSGAVLLVIAGCSFVAHRLGLNLSGAARS